MISNKNMANALGGKTARACDSCIRQRARWYCAADDAFLCQACDSSVHSANPLARRHERVRLKIASFKSLDLVSKEISSVPCWHRGFTRKARTPRHGKPAVFSSKISEKLRNPIPIPLVPELGSDEMSHEDNEHEQLLYRVPIFDPFVAELCTSTTTTTTTTTSNEAETILAAAERSRKGSFDSGGGQDVDQNLHGFPPSDMDLAEFAADVESLLGKGLENESFGMEELGLADCQEEKEILRKDCYVRRGKLKTEEIEKEEEEEDDVRECHVDTEIDMAREQPFEFSFDYDSATCGDEDERADLKNKIEECEDNEDDDENKKIQKKKRINLLSLDYEAVITAWASQGSPWTTGNRPEVDSDEYWPDYPVICGAELHQFPYGEHDNGVRVHPAMATHGGREARVSRYREKRRTRLFSKKIRYEVRKLNAEKRPRMKGRFVKRTSFATPAFPLHSK